MALGLYRVSVLALAGLQFPRPTSEDHEFIHNAYQSGWTVKKTVRRLKEKVKPAAAPTPVEPRCQRCGGTGVEPGHPLWNCRRCKGAPAESQGVERAQPVEGPREFPCEECRKRDCGVRRPCECKNPLCPCAPAPVEGVERVTDDAPARVEPTDWWPEDSTGKKLKPCGEAFQFRGDSEPRTRCKLPPNHDGEHANGNVRWMPAAQPAKHTDDLKEMSKGELYAELLAEGIDPAELSRKMLDKLEAKAKEYASSGEKPPPQFVEALRQFRASNPAPLGEPRSCLCSSECHFDCDEAECLCPHHRPANAAQPVRDDRQAETIPDNLKVRYAFCLQKEAGDPVANWHYGVERKHIEELGRAETRIEVLEAALRAAVKTLSKKVPGMYVESRKIVIARLEEALAAPSGEKGERSE